MNASQLNFHHLRYFWAVAREGGVGRAAEKLRVSQPSLSAQIRLLEAALDRKLFARAGRRLVLTEAGRLALGYAEQIFGLGGEMLDALQDRPVSGALRTSVGIANAVPKGIAYRVLASLLSPSLRLECPEGSPEALLAELAVHRLDAVLADAPAPAGIRLVTFSHRLGETGIALFGRPPIVRAHRRRFPASLDGAPLLLPTAATSLRRSLDAWFERHKVRPKVVAELEDSALLEAFASSGAGLVPAPVVLERDLRRRGLEPLGRMPGVRERFYAITAERRLRHEGVAALVAQAGRWLA